MKLEKPDVKPEHIVAALKLQGRWFSRVAKMAEQLADLDTAKELEELAKSLPISGGPILAQAKAHRKRASLHRKGAR